MPHPPNSPDTVTLHPSQGDAIGGKGHTFAPEGDTFAAHSHRTAFSALGPCSKCSIFPFTAAPEGSWNPDQVRGDVGLFWPLRRRAQRIRAAWLGLWPSSTPPYRAAHGHALATRSASCLFWPLRRRAQRIRAAWLSPYRAARGRALATRSAPRTFQAKQLAPRFLVTAVKGRLAARRGPEAERRDAPRRTLRQMPEYETKTVTQKTHTRIHGALNLLLTFFGEKLRG